MFAVGLYTGMRPNEYKTAKLEGNFIVANNSKRKNGKVELKLIPINPMLKPNLEGVTDLTLVRLNDLRTLPILTRIYPTSSCLKKALNSTMHEPSCVPKRVPKSKITLKIYLLPKTRLHMLKIKI